MSNQEMHLSKRANLALAILKAWEKSRASGGPYNKDIAAVLFTMGDQLGFNTMNVALRPIANGFYSEDVETMIGHFLSSGCAQQESPIWLAEDGIGILWEILQDEYTDDPSTIEQALKALDLDSQKLTPATM